jgi:nicotinamide-nucleotide amidase
MRLNIITIGDELLYGQTIDTNSAWMAQELNANGWEVYEKIAVGDSKKNIIETLTKSLVNVDVVLITGGLGPTSDDLTMPVLAEYFNSKIIFNEDVLNDISKMLIPRGIAINENNRKQAYVPEKCIPIRNKLGTAPGLWFSIDGKIVVSMPGVPHEMRGMMNDFVLPRLAEINENEIIIHKFILTLGIPEAILAEKIEPWEKNIPLKLNLAYLPSPGMVKLRLTAKGKNKNELTELINKQVALLKPIINEYIFGYDNDTLSSVIGMLLKKHNLKLSVAESCTGGYLSHLITEIPGSSIYYEGGIVSYSNAIKVKTLGVNPLHLTNYGAVSQQVVEDMALGANATFNTDFSVATSGIAGPEGGSKEKPVGTVWIAVAYKSEVISEKFNFGNNRERNIIRASNMALMLLRKEIITKFE